MQLKTFDKKDAVHALNICSMVMAWGVASYSLNAEAVNGAADFIFSLLIVPLNLIDQVFLLITGMHLPLRFNVIFLTLWISYFLALRHFHPVLMVRNHGEEELRRWYLSKGVRN